MALPTFNTKSPTIKRILKEASELSTNPDPSLHASPLDADLFEWHFTLAGPPNTPYSAGIYHGRIVLPPTYPLRPPSFRFLTPSGRFEVNREICLSISGHHEETWQPAWGIRTALWALRAFMEGGARGQVGGMEMGDAERRRLAAESTAWTCAGCGGRSNGEILRAEEERCRSPGESVLPSGGGTVPEELKFGFRDEMAAEAENSSARDQAPAIAPLPSSSPAPLQSSAPPASSLPRPPPSSPPALPTASPPPTAPLGPSSEAVPPWVDKAIAGLVAGLAVMVIKKIVL